MSTYVFSEGKITFKTQKDMDSGLAPLFKGGWLNEKNQWTTDGDVIDDAINHNSKSIDGLSLNIIPSLYRNLGSVIEEVLIFADEGNYVESCEDGDLYVYVWQDGGSMQVSHCSLANHVSDSIEKDSLTLMDDEWMEKYEDKDEDDYYEYRGKALNNAATEIKRVLKKG